MRTGPHGRSGDRMDRILVLHDSKPNHKESTHEHQTAAYQGEVGNVTVAEELQSISARRQASTVSHYYEIKPTVCERMHRPIEEEFFVSVFRKTFYERVDQLQQHLDAYLNLDNPRA